MASESKTSLPLKENSDSSDWSSDDEKEKEKPRQIIIKNIQLHQNEEKKDTASGKVKVKKRKKLVSVCLTHCRYDVIRRVAAKFGYKEVSEGENWNMYWTDLSITVDKCKEMKRFQKINHFPVQLTMWMQYSAQRWVRAEDIKSAIERLSCELSDLIKDSQHSLVYDTNVFYDIEETERIEKDCRTYAAGANLCYKYSRGFLNLDEFCEHMIRIELRHFLYDLVKYLPKELIEKYQLDQSDGDTGS